MRNRTRVAVAIGVAVLLVASGVAYLILHPAGSGNGPSAPAGMARCPSSPGGASAGNWTTFHQDNSREGTIGPGGVPVPHPAPAFQATLDGQIYAEPLLCGDTAFVATEDDSVYALNATSGSVLWRAHLGTPVPGSALPCGDINPSGITGTPVIDVATGTLYAVAFEKPAQHVLYGISTSNGTVVSHAVVDPSGADPTVEQQRGALALADGAVYIPFGGLDGDCGAYHGWVVGVRTDGAGGLLAYQVPTHREGGIWSTGGIAVGGNGNLFVSTGNGDSTSTFDYGDSVLELAPNLTLLDYFAPTNWAQLNRDDTDLGSLAPTLLSNGDLFQIGKEGVGDLLASDHLGGIGGQIYNASVCGGAYGGTAHVGLSILVPCNDGLVDVQANASNFFVEWRSTSFDAGSPIVVGEYVWVVDVSSASLLGLNLSTGQPAFSFALGSVEHFISPAGTTSDIYVGAGDQLDAFSLD